MIHAKSLCLLACLCTASLPASPSASAQVLPSGSQDKGGDLAPHVVCTSCQTRNYTFPSNAQRDENGRIVTWCATCKQDRPHEANYQTDLGLSGGKRESGQGGLKLPRSTAPAAPAQTQPKPASAPEAPAPAVVSAPQEPVAVDPAAAFVFQGVRRQRGIDERLVNQAVDTLVSMGAQGQAAARAELAAKEAGVVLVAGRVLLASKDPVDHELVLQCLRLTAPAGAGAALLGELLRVDPVRVPPRVLIEFMDAREPGLRLAASRELRTRMQPDLLPEIEAALGKARTDARLELLSLVGDLDTPDSTRVLLSHLADPAPRVAGQVLAELAGRKDPQLDTTLLQSAFSERWILRAQAYALLALVEREDLAQRAILNETHVPTLLEAMESKDPFVAGASATALAGIGFRSPRADTRAWLDQGVVDRLVSVASGKVFHNDFVTLQAPVSRRLRQVSGQEFTEGPAWVTWWIDNRAGFRAQRAQLVVGEGESARLAVSMKLDGQSWLLLGPAEPEPASMAAGTISFRVTEAEARALLALLEREGLLGAERLPGVRGVRGARERVFSVSVAGRSKQFLLGVGLEEAWFERCVAAVRSLAHENRWQQYPTPGKHAGRAELWAEESGWWASHHDPLERAAALKKLVLAMLQATRNPQDKARGLTELDELFREHPSAAVPDDFRALLALMRGAGPQELASLVRMATIAAQSFDAQRREVPREMARELVQSVEDPALLEIICEAAPLSFSQSLLGETRPALRAAGARALGRKGGPDVVPQLMTMLSDKSPEAEAAAVEGLGLLKAEAARTELLVRARLGLEPVRVAALRAIGALKGEFVLDALLLGLSDRNPAVRAAAVQGLGLLDDPATAPFLISLLAEGTNSEVYAPAREALRKLGVRAQTDLERIASSPTHRARLEAALLLAEMCDPIAVPSLLGALTLDPRNARLSFELAVLTCVDASAQPDPAGTWWEWWDGVVHDNAQAWLRAACERLSIQPISAEELQAPLRDTALSLCIELMRRPENWLAERGRRELARICGEVLPALPAAGAARTMWIDALQARLKKSS